MKKRMEKVTKEKASSGGEEKPLKASDICTVQTIEHYQCTGNVELDFPKLCALAGMRLIPALRLQTATSTSTDEAIEEAQDAFGIHLISWSPCLQIELENEDSRSVKRIRISGWTVDELMTRVLSVLLPSLSNLQSLEMWQAGVTDHIMTSLKNTVSMCSNLRKVVLEGNPITEQSFHILMKEDSMITHLSLRNNRIGEEGAHLIGTALSSNKNLVSLNMAFNCIGDAGAMHIAQGLRFNRTILCFSLANNHIGDAGASFLAEVLCPFALTHEEIVERRRLLIRIHQLPAQTVREDSKCEQPLSIHSSSSLEQIHKRSKYAIKKKDSSRKEDKPAASQKVATAGKKEDNNKLVKKTSESKLPRGKSDTKDKQPSVVQKESGEMVETQSPLLDPSVQHVDGKVIYPGNTTLKSLNLSGNKLTPKSLEMFLSSVRSQGEAGLLRLSLDRNSCPAECDVFLKIHKMMSIKAPLNKTQMEDEQRQAA